MNWIWSIMFYLSFFFLLSYSLKIRFEQSKKPLGVTFQFSHFYINQKSPPSSITYYYYVWLRCTIGDIKEEGGPKLRYFCWFYFFTGSREQSPTWFSLTPILIYLFNLLLLSIWCHFSHKLTNKSVTAQNIWPKLTFHK